MTAAPSLPPLLPSPWACAWGQDSYGYWQAIELQGVRQVMRWIPPGQFMMGSPENEPERYDDETLHQIVLTEGYWLADTACSQALWQAVMKTNPSHFKDNPQHPVEEVSWQDCKDFFDQANTLLVGLQLRFPTEAEWEYACRAGTTTPFSFGDALSTESANYDGSSPYNNQPKGKYREKAVVVDEFIPNPWGLYQMHGNVWEWCQDWYDKTYPAGTATNPQGPDQGSSRVLRGGSWFDGGRYLRSAFRDFNGPDFRSIYWGFRLAGGDPQASETVARG